MLQTFTVNGRPVTSSQVSEELHALCCSPCGRFLVTGGEGGMATLRWLHSLEAIIRYEIGHGPITALTITPEECLLIGDALSSLLPDRSPRSCLPMTLPLLMIIDCLVFCHMQDPRMGRWYCFRPTCGDTSPDASSSSAPTPAPRAPQPS